MSNREDYLDSLLKTVTYSEDEDVMPSTEEQNGEKPEKKQQTVPEGIDDDFLREFDQEFQDIDEDAFLRDYEQRLGIQQMQDVSVEEAEDKLMDTMSDMMVDTISKEELEGKSALEQELGGLFEDDVFLEDDFPASEEASKEAKAAPPPESDSQSKSPKGTEAAPLPGEDKIFDVSDLDLTGVDYEVLGTDGPKPASDEKQGEDEELMDLLAGLSGDGDLAEIGDMLKAHDDAKLLFEEEMSRMDGDLKDGMDELGFLDNLQAEGGEEEKPGKKKKKRKEKKQKKKKEKGKADKGEKSGGFFAKMGDTLFGEDEENAADPAGGKQAPDIDGMAAETISEENKSILMEFEDQGKGKKGKKKKDKKEKSDKKKEKEEKKKEKAEKKKAKPPKPKKEKKPKGKREPIPVKALIVTAMVGASIVVLVNLGGSLLGYESAVREAESAYGSGDYVSAYRKLEGIKIKKGDQKLYDRVKVVAILQKQMDFYEVYIKAQMYPEALDALMQALDRYDTKYEEAVQAGAEGEFDRMYGDIEQKLSESFSVTVEEARQTYASGDRKEYTAKLQELLVRAGLFEEGK